MVTSASVTSDSVLATAVLTDTRFGRALIQIHAALSTGQPCVSRCTDTYICTNQVLAGHASAVTVIYTICTLILVFTHPPVLPQHVACWAFTLVRTHYINTAEGTQQRILGALVDVFAGHHWPRLKAVIARTLKSPNNISACAVSTGISDVALISVFTCDSTNVKAVSHGTFTAERAVCVNALAINTRTIEAFINIFWMFIWSTLISLVRAEIAIPLLSFHGADFTGVSPALTWHADATAHFLGSVLRFWSLTAPIFKLGIAVVHTDIYTSPSRRRELEAFRAQAGEASLSVRAGSILTDLR